MKRKSILVMAISFVLALALGTAAYAWSPAEQALLDQTKGIAAGNAGKWSLAEAAKPYTGVTLKILADAATEADAPQKYDAEFTQQTGIKVVWEQNPWDEHRSKLFMDFAAGPEATIWYGCPLMTWPAVRGRDTCSLLTSI